MGDHLARPTTPRPSSQFTGAADFGTRQGSALSRARSAVTGEDHLPADVIARGRAHRNSARSFGHGSAAIMRREDTAAYASENSHMR
jgi:hypothetical protein